MFRARGASSAASRTRGHRAVETPQARVSARKGRARSGLCRDLARQRQALRNSQDIGERDPAPYRREAQFLAALSQRTKRLRFGPLVYLFPFYHPLRLAEEICMLDQLSNGRLDVGLGRGISPIESRLFANDPEQAQRILDECRTIVLTALSNGRGEHRGEMFTFENVEMSVAPFQKPHPPLWYGTSSAETAERCARSGYHLINNDMGERARDVASRYATECERQGNLEYRSGLTRYIVVADTDSDAFEIGRSAYPSWHRSFVALYRKYGRGPVTGERDPEFAAHVETGKAVVGSRDRRSHLT